MSRPPAGERRAVIDIFQRMKSGDAPTGVKSGERVRERVLRGPAYVVEQIAVDAGITGANQPITAIGRWPDNRIPGAKRAKCIGDMVRVEFRYIAADDDRRHARNPAQRSPHTVAEITRALRNPGNPTWPEPALARKPVGRHREPCLPSVIGRESAEQGLHRFAVKPPGSQRANVGREPSLDAADPWRSHEQIDMAEPSHQP